MGVRGERLAEASLVRAGYEVLERNYRSGAGEIDLIVRREGRIAFVEVKTAAQPVFGRPERWVTPAKRRRIASVARDYLHRTAQDGGACRFDVVAVELPSGALPCIRHFENAFRADL